MLKLIGGILVAGSGVGLAVNMIAEIRQHLLRLYEIRQLLINISGEAALALLPMEHILNQPTLTNDVVLQKVCGQIADRLAAKKGESGGEIWWDIFWKNRKELGICASELEIIANAGNAFFGRNIKETTSDIAKENNAIFAINGDFYGFMDSGPVIRNGVLYRSNERSGSNDVLAVYNDGSFVTMKEENVDSQNLLDSGVLQLFSFGPSLVDNGQISVSANQEVEQSMNSNPRTAIGMISPLHYVFVVSDGRTSESAGLSLAQLAAVMQDAGCQCAYNLDGGGSSTMWFMGDVVNNPTTNGNSISERKVSDIVYIGQ